MLALACRSSSSGKKIKSARNNQNLNSMRQSSTTEPKLSSVVPFDSTSPYNDISPIQDERASPEKKIRALTALATFSIKPKQHKKSPRLINSPDFKVDLWQHNNIRPSELGGASLDPPEDTAEMRSENVYECYIKG